ncbi:MAG: transglycosylase domain-containing protein, partial [Steroidobacteraceae bacterium]
MAVFSNLKRQILAGALLILGVLLIAALVSVIYLDRKITAQFEGRRWTLPAQVFAQPVELYAGQAFGADALEQELKRLGYQRVSQAERPGSYSRRGNRVDLVNRRFRFWDALQESQLLSVTARGNTIASMENGRGEEVPIFRLDPLLIGSIFPIHGEDRVVVKPEEVSPLLPAALKVVEDREFESHMGIDFSAIARAAWVNLRAGHIEQGGSTLT